MSKEVIRLWTCQNKIVLDTIMNNDVYHVKREYITNKYEEVSKIFLTAYDWFVGNAQNILHPPEKAKFPIWTWTDPKHVEHFQNSVILVLEIEKDHTILFDSGKWNKILNLSYIPKDENDKEKFIKELERYNITDDSEAYMSNFYPQLKSRIRRSWDRLFDEDIKISGVNQAALWEIRKEWIVNIIEN
ncbi:DUF3841 domain-containing protein [Anaeromicrobium sediminis]|uniref:DUF3841 domain-containing protein n=1 Tax=Anaeromicrobium sediminis TaxID=1478221 RepID=A0A267MH92_9FIRM|nr:DUF3841 domain-containing protein [Anaeromicrobium sediminis]PAB58782.1 hypothetical protein CCE28_12865 [Anaeromicrobium sediminis]